MSCEDGFDSNFTASNDTFFCPIFIDNAETCWPITPAGSLVVRPCPQLFDDLPPSTGNVTKYCLENGTWDRSDYRPCIPLSTSDSKADQHPLTIIRYVGFSISVVALSIALFLFLYFRSLRCLRNTIHCHLIVSLLLRYLFWIKTTAGLPQLIEHDANDLHQVFCKAMITLFNYLIATNFFWMLIEGLYLHTVLVWSFHQDRLRFWHYALIGWGLPAVFICIWSIVKVHLDDNACWLPNSNFNYDLITIVPIIAVLLLNLAFLLSIVWILITKLRASNSSQNCLYRKAAKATLILFPLLGMTYLLLIFNPSYEQFRFLVYINTVLQATQGLSVATFYCFLNTEVQNAVKKRFNRWRDGRSLSLGRTQTSMITQGDQVSLHGVSKDEVQSKSKGSTRQTDSTDSRKKCAVPNDRGHTNGLHKEHPERALLTSDEFEENRNGRGNNDPGFDQRHIRNDHHQSDYKYDYFQNRHEQTTDEEEDITKEDLV